MFVFSSSELTLEAEVGGGVHDNRGESHNVPKRLNAVTEGEQRSGVVLTVKRRETSLTEIFNLQSFTPTRALSKIFRIFRPIGSFV